MTELDFLNKPSVSAYFERCWQASTKKLMEIQAEKSMYIRGLTFAVCQFRLSEIVNLPWYHSILSYSTCIHIFQWDTINFLE